MKVVTEWWCLSGARLTEAGAQFVIHHLNGNRTTLNMHHGVDCFSLYQALDDCRSFGRCEDYVYYIATYLQITTFFRGSYSLIEITCFAVESRESCSTVALVTIDLINTRSSVEARMTGTLVDIWYMIYSLETFCFFKLKMMFVWHEIWCNIWVFTV